MSVNKFKNGQLIKLSGGGATVATSTTAGIVRPDGTTITVDADGTIHGASDVSIDNDSITKNSNDELQAVKVNGHTVLSNVPANAVFTDTTYTAATSSVIGLVKPDNSTIAVDQNGTLTVILGSTVVITTEDEDLFGTVATLSIGGNTYTGGFSSTGRCVIKSISETGVATITVSDGNFSNSTTLNITGIDTYAVTIDLGTAYTINISTTEETLKLKQVTVSNGNINITKTINLSGSATVKVRTIGSWTVTATDGTNTDTKIVTVVSEIITYNVELAFEEYYEFHINGTVSAPDQMITYPSGCPNENYTPMSVNLSTGVPNYGSWATLSSDGSTFTKAPFWWPRSCELNHDGTVNAYLNEADNTKRLDGTISYYNSTSYDGEIMVEFPISYITITPDSGSDVSGTVRISNKNSTGAICVRDANGNPATWYAAKYTGTSNGARSLSGLGNYVSQNSSTETTSCRRHNKTSDVIWDKQTYVQWLIFNIYLTLIGKTAQTQTKFGYGRCSSSNSSAINTGTMDTSGFFWGSSNQTSGVKCFGVENPWGNVWRRIHGLINASGTCKYKLCKGTEDGSSATDYNDAGTNYLTLSGYTFGGTNGGYINKMVVSSNGLFAVTSSGSESTYWCDGLWFNNSQVNVAAVGGNWVDAGHVGTFYVDLSVAASAANASIAAALSCIPLAA